MPPKTLLCITGVHHSDGDLDAAIAVCENSGAHLSVLVAAFAAPPPIGAYGALISDDWAEERQSEAEELRERGEHIEALLQRKSVSADVALEYCETYQAPRVIGVRARYADMVVLGPELLTDEELKLQAVNGALFESARPLLLLPRANPGVLQPKSVLLAWDSSLEAARAVSASLEIMARADEVHVVIIDPAPGPGLGSGEPGADIGAYLARHGVKVSVDQTPSAGKKISEAIAQRAGDVAADLLIMGAYGHSRLSERIFGGVTKDFINEPSMPVLMAH